MNYELHHGDCLEIMPTLEAGSVDAIISDVPFGTSECSWDVIVPLAPMWECIKHVISTRGAVVLFGSQPFTSLLITSKLDWYRYGLVWDKGQTTDFQHANNRPMREHEDINVFCRQSPIYNPQMTLRDKPLDTRNWKSLKNGDMMRIRSNERVGKINAEKYPTSIIRVNSCSAECNNTKRVHPTQKPVALMSYLIRTYTNEGDTVLDFTMGSGSTGVACAETGRNFIGIELDANYFAIAQDRIDAAYRKAQGMPRKGKATDRDDLPMFAMA